MARYDAESRMHIDATVQTWRDVSLIGDASFTHPDEHPSCWSIDTVTELHHCFLGKPLEGAEGGGTFQSKWEVQLDGASTDVRVLAAEILAVYYLPTGTVGWERKLGMINATISDTSLQLDADSTEDLVLATDESIANPGGRYNMRQDQHVGYLIDLALRLKTLSPDQRCTLLTDHPWEFGDFADDVGPGVSAGEMRHLVCHLLYPDHYERIASGTHKRQVLAAFGSLVPEVGEDSVDQRLFAIRHALEERIHAIPAEDLDFYRSPLVEIWRSHGDSGEELSDLAAIRHKGQIVYYGPPGTGKTYRARELAATLIRGAALRRWSVDDYFTHLDVVEAAVKKNVTRLQLHPGIGYPEFIIGLQLDDQGGTSHVPGVLPRLVEEMVDERADDAKKGLRALPRVLILDEINRTDLSVMFGEAFSALESDKRNEPILLPGTKPDGQPYALVIPDDLFLVGTMNEIDHSVEALDFALRRRFFWFRQGFDEDGLYAIWESGWKEAEPRVSFSAVQEELRQLVNNIAAVNDLIAHRPELGAAYELGHAFFGDLPFFVAERWPTRRPAGGRVLWSAKGDPLSPLNALWNYTVQPLVEQYLAAADDRVSAIDGIRTAFYRHG